VSDTDVILQALKEHREETRQDLHELRQATVKVADAAAEMGKTMARSEERHASHEDAMKRIGRNLDDHEVRLRSLEADRVDPEEVKRQADDMQQIKTQLVTGRASLFSGWKVLTVVAALAAGAAAFGKNLVELMK